MRFSRDDWEPLRDLEGLSQKAGVPRRHLAKLVVKELADNALDEVGGCEVGLLDGGGFYVSDAGDGIPGTDEEIAELFSVDRPLVTTKMLRLPTRGRLGHGLRVVAGAVLASGGSLRVSTLGRTISLSPRDDGKTRVAGSQRWDGRGTRIEVVLGPSIPTGDDLLEWAEQANAVASGTKRYRGRSSPWWYDADSFFQVCQGAREETVLKLVSLLDGCSRERAAQLAAPYRSRRADSLSREEAAELLRRAQSDVEPVKPERLGGVGRKPELGRGYAKASGTCRYAPAGNGPGAVIPYVVEAWAECDDADGMDVLINRTPIVAEVHGRARKRVFSMWGCGLRHEFEVGDRACSVVLNLESPHVPLTSDGKSPDLSPFATSIHEVLERAVRIARKRAEPRSGGLTDIDSTKDVVLEVLPDAIEKASGGGTYRFSLRQLFYVVRAEVLERCGKELDYNYFTQIVTHHEATVGEDIPGIYRDPRGTLYHPHLGRDIRVGTIAVEEYERPEWTFNKILYVEKEGFFPILRESRWPERHDCALLTSKGFATRAVRDVMDLIGETDEEITFFCIHDADAAGGLIYEKLQRGTKARAGRSYKVVNLGLEPAEALAMGLLLAVARNRANPLKSAAGPHRGR